ncbi:MAG: GMP synthase [Legionella longbeachae]|nr:GMP synthase [Legionella longbeachae]
MHLGILKCDTVSDVFVPEHGQYPEMFATLLSSVDPTLKFTIYDAEHGELPSDLHEVDAYLITGSRHGVNDGYSWINQLEEFILRLHHAQKKVLGICFGHQLIAKVLGGRVIKSPKGWGVGILNNTLYIQKSWMNPQQKTINILASHQDQVVELPFEAEVLAGSEFCPNYMMQIGNHFLTIQGHPEFTKAYSRDLMISREDTIDEQEFTRGMSSLTLNEDDEIIAQWMMNFLTLNSTTK